MYIDMYFSGRVHYTGHIDIDENYCEDINRRLENIFGEDCPHVDPSQVYAVWKSHGRYLPQELPTLYGHKTKAIGRTVCEMMYNDLYEDALDSPEVSDMMIPTWSSDDNNWMPVRIPEND